MDFTRNIVAKPWYTRPLFQLLGESLLASLIAAMICATILHYMLVSIPYADESGPLSILKTILKTPKIGVGLFAYIFVLFTLMFFREKKTNR